MNSIAWLVDQPKIVTTKQKPNAITFNVVDMSRLQRYLSQGSATASECAEVLEMKKSKIDKMLAKLEKDGVVTHHRRSKTSVKIWRMA